MPSAASCRPPFAPDGVFEVGAAGSPCGCLPEGPAQGSHRSGTPCWAPGLSSGSGEQTDWVAQREDR